MKQFMTFAKILTPIFIIFLFIACGGGSSGSSPDDSVNESTNTTTDLDTKVSVILTSSMDAAFVVMDDGGSDGGSSSARTENSLATVASASLSCAFGGTVEYSGEFTESETVDTIDYTLTLNSCNADDITAVSGTITFGAVFTKTSETSGNVALTFNGTTTNADCSLTFDNLVMEGPVVNDETTSIVLTGSISVDCGTDGSLTCDWTDGLSIDNMEMSDEDTAQLIADNCS